MLQSSGLRERAWGAWSAGVSHDRTLVPLLIERLRDAQALPITPDGEAYAYVQSLFDALIQLDANVPTAVLIPFEDFWRADILILMNEAAPRLDRDAETGLLNMRDHRMPEEEWTSLNDLLFLIDPPVASRMLLRDIRITYEFCVTDQAIMRADDGSAGIGESTRHLPAGFPPIGLYQIRTYTAGKGDALFIAEPIPTYYARVVVPTDQEVKWSVFEYHGASTSARQRTLERLFSIFHPRDDIFHPWAAVDWQGTEKTGARIAQLLDDQAESIRAVLREMLRRGLISAAGTQMDVAVRVRDCRRSHQDALPDVAPTRTIAFP